MKWLFVTTEFPWPLAHGTSLRVYHLSRTLVTLGDEVSLLSSGSADEGSSVYAGNGVSVLFPSNIAPNPPTPTQAWPSEGSLYDFDPRLSAALEACSGRYDGVVLVRPAAQQYAREARSAPFVLADMVDDPIEEERRRLWRDPRPAHVLWRLRFGSRQKRFEQRVLPFVDATSFVSQPDAERFSRRHGGARVAVIPNGVDAEFFRPPADLHEASGGENAARPRITFLGNLTHKPNEDAAIHLLRDIAPRIRCAAPQARFCILGTNPSPAIAALAKEDVEITGFVEDVRPYLWQSALALLPLRMGTGIKNKILEVWAAGVPVVATPLGCAGAPARDGENLLLRRTPKELAQACVSLLQDAPLRKRLALAGQQTVLESFRWESVAGQLRALPEAMPLASPPRHRDRS